MKEESEKERRNDETDLNCMRTNEVMVKSLEG